MSQWVSHRDPRYFPDPEAFRPERWLDGLAKRIPKYAYYPFGGGPRVCIGNSFAMMESVLLLATIARQWSLAPMPDHPIRLAPVLTLRPRYGIKVVMHRRPSAGTHPRDTGGEISLAVQPSSSADV